MESADGTRIAFEPVGEGVPVVIVGAVERLAAAMPQADLVVVPESHDDGVDPEATARLIRSRVPG